MILFLANGATSLAASGGKLIILSLSGEIISPGDVRAIQRKCALSSYNNAHILGLLRYYMDSGDILYTILIFHINGLTHDFRRQ